MSGLNIGALLQPTRQTQLLKETAVVWDTAIFEEWLVKPQWRLGWDIDGQRIRLGYLTPQYRFYTVKDIFAAFPPGIYGQNKPVVLNVGNGRFYNRDPGSIAAEGGTQYPFQGNLRFRHQKNSTCNVGFSDGSVRQFTAKVNPDLTVKSHDALRRYFMIKWPTGIRPNRQYPH
jgi:prepilin-type processing-associated H-X9-DG protein